MSKSVTRRVISLLAVWELLGLWLGQPAHAETLAPSVQYPTIHIVQRNETLESIAQLYHMMPAVLVSANAITSAAEIAVGDRLLIPMPSLAGSVPAGVEITAGFEDTLDVLVARYGVAARDIAVTNHFVRPDGVFVGQSLIVPLDRQQLASTTRVTYVSSQTPLWRVALGSKSNLVTLALINHLGQVRNPIPGTAVVLPAGATFDDPFAGPWGMVQLHPLPMEAGRTGGLRLTMSGQGTLAGKFLSHDLRFVQNGTEYFAVFGIDRWTKPGMYPLLLTFTDSNGKVWNLERNIVIVKGNYAREKVTLPEDAAAARSDPQTVASEQAYVFQKMSGFTPHLLWSGDFQIPTPGILTSAFGSVRSINGSGYDSYHTGNDLAISPGTPITAPAAGTIVDTGRLEIRGLVTIINHGAGVFTGYWHQSSILVRPGDTVVAGQTIGTVGDTGSSTASHLHWEMWVGGVPVDALQWVRETFP